MSNHIFQTIITLPSNKKMKQNLECLKEVQTQKISRKKLISFNQIKKRVCFIQTNFKVRTSIGGNVEEAIGGISRKDFRADLPIYIRTLVFLLNGTG